MADNPQIGLALLEPFFADMLPHIQKHGGRRIECKTRVAPDRRGVHDLLRLLGFKLEGRFHKYGTDGSDFFIVAYLVEPAEKPATKPAPVNVHTVADAAVSAGCLGRNA